MKTVVVLGAGKIGRMVTHFLVHSGDYRVVVGDSSEGSLEHLNRLETADSRKIDLQSASDLDSVLAGTDAAISCAPFHCNPLIAERARHHRTHYLDLTEDVEVTRQVVALADGAESALIPQCGLAPGFITICSMHLIEQMTAVRDLRMRVGALPRYPSNRMKYNLTWSTEGLINEYCQPCEVILNGERRSVQPLENLETLTIDGVEYEAFNTSGGLGTLCDTLAGKVRNLNYKSIRFPGHSYLLKFLLKDLQLQNDQAQLREIFERCLPATYQDQIVVFVSATGMYHDRLTEATYARTIRHREIDGELWSGIQITTAAGVCGVLDLLFEGHLPERGLVRQEQVDYDRFIKNRFGRYYA